MEFIALITCESFESHIRCFSLKADYSLSCQILEADQKLYYLERFWMTSISEWMNACAFEKLQNLV